LGLSLLLFLICLMARCFYCRSFLSEAKGVEVGSFIM
jgi:hypothetical protein